LKCNVRIREDDDYGCKLKEKDVQLIIHSEKLINSSSRPPVEALDRTLNHLSSCALVLAGKLERGRTPLVFA